MQTFETYRQKNLSNPINERGDRYRVWLRNNHLAGVWEQRHDWHNGDGKTFEGGWINAHYNHTGKIDLDLYEPVGTSEAV